MYLMGVDLGTSSLKVLIVDASGHVLGSGRKRYQFDMPVNGFAEQWPDVWWDACCDASQQALREADVPANAISAIGISGQMHGLVALDAEMRPLRPAILHCDSRSAAQVEEIHRQMRREEIAQWIRNPINSGFWLPSLLWMREHEPELYAKIRRLALPKDYLRYKMTGEYATDYSDASATLMFDVENLCWSRQVLERFDIPADILPEPDESFCVAGRITAAAAAAMGVAEGTKVVYGGGDQNMQAIGNGAISDGISTITIGSSGQICFPITHLVDNTELRCNLFCGYRKKLWIVMGATLNAGMCYQWLLDILGCACWEDLNRLAEKVQPGSGGLLFLPFFTGERYLANANLSGAFMGLNYATSRGQLARAVMEGVVYALRDCLKLLQAMGLNAREMIASGGGARSSEWLSIQADILNKPLRLSCNEEQAALGACIVAGVGAGIYASVEEGCNAIIRYSDRVVEPDPRRHEVYQAYHALFDQALVSQQDVIEKLTLLGRQETVMD